MNRHQRRAARGSANRRRKEFERKRHDLELQEYVERLQLLRDAHSGEPVVIDITPGWNEGPTRSPVDDLLALLVERPTVTFVKNRSVGPTTCAISVEAAFRQIHSFSSVVSGIGKTPFAETSVAVVKTRNVGPTTTVLERFAYLDQREAEKSVGRLRPLTDFIEPKEAK